MKKEYYDEEKSNYIAKKLQSKKINETYIPIIIDIMLRRRYEYGLSDNFFERDVESFVKNVKTIEVAPLTKSKGSFRTSEKKIVLDPKLFGEDANNEELYSVLAHECTHAMNFEKIDGDKQDRTFPANCIYYTTGAIEAFTECESNDLVYNTSYIDSENKVDDDNPEKMILLKSTSIYRLLTPYVDLMVATFGVQRKEMLSAAIKGQDELKNLLSNNLGRKYKIPGKDRIFDGITMNICLLHSAIFKDQTEVDENNFSLANEKIYNYAEEAIIQRMGNMQTSDLSRFQEQFNRIKLDQKIIETICESCYAPEEKESLREETNGKYALINNKLRCMDEIFINDNIQDKQRILQELIMTENSEELIKLMEDNEITVDLEKEIIIPIETIKEHNMEYSLYGMEWDNTEILEYIEAHKEEMTMPKLTKFQSIMKKVKEVFHKNDIKSLPEGSEYIKDKILPSWDLSHWGMKKEELAKVKCEDHSREESSEQREDTSLEKKSEERE